MKEELGKGDNDKNQEIILKYLKVSDCLYCIQNSSQGSGYIPQGGNSVRTVLALLIIGSLL